MNTVVRNVSLGSPAALVTTTGLKLADGITYQEWLEIGLAMASMSENLAWCWGDWLQYGETYEHGQYDRAVELTGRDKVTVRKWKQVAAGVERDRRRADSTHLRWSHFAEIAHLDVEEQERLLDDCERLGWSMWELREAIARERGDGIVRPPALSVRAAGELLVRWESRAQARGVDAKELVLAVLELASQLDDPVAVLQAAGATLPDLALEAA